MKTDTVVPIQSLQVGEVVELLNEPSQQGMRFVNKPLLLTLLETGYSHVSKSRLEKMMPL